MTDRENRTADHLWTCALQLLSISVASSSCNPQEIFIRSNQISPHLLGPLLLRAKPRGINQRKDPAIVGRNILRLTTRVLTTRALTTRAWDSALSSEKVAELYERFGCRSRIQEELERDWREANLATKSHSLRFSRYTTERYKKQKRAVIQRCTDGALTMCQVHELCARVQSFSQLQVGLF